MTKTYIIKQVYTDRCENCCEIIARNSASALKKYAKGLMSSGEKTLISENGLYKLITSYGAEFVAEKIQER